MCDANRCIVCTTGHSDVTLVILRKKKRKRKVKIPWMNTQTRQAEL